MIVRIKQVWRRELPILALWLGLALVPGRADEGLAAFQRGAFDQAVAHWEKSLSLASQTPGRVDLLLNLAAAYQALGQQSRAVEMIEEGAELAEKLEKRDLIVRAKAKLGMGLTMTRQFERAEKLLRESLELAREDQNEHATAAALNDLGNLLAVEGRADEALSAFEESAALARKRNESALLARALSNRAAAAARAGKADVADSVNGEALAVIEKLEPSHDKAFLFLTAAQTDSLISPGAARLLLRSRQSAASALELAETLSDRGMTSYALGYLGQLYQKDGQLEHALSLTRRAAFAAQQARIPDALYRWEWQSGRILKAQGKTSDSIAAYRRAVQTLQPIQHDAALGYGNATAQLSFRDSNGPLFFELADLLLAQAKDEKDAARAQELLRDARDTVEQLKAVELEDYFQDDCVNVLRSKSASLEKVDPHSAVMYLVPLPDRTEVLVSLDSGMHRYTASINADALVALVREFRLNLETRTTYAYLEQAQQLYDLIIRPIRPLLTENQIGTLVFVPDGALQTIPLASLHDGKKFLVEEFAVTVTPGLSLVEPRPIERKKAQVLLSGLSQEVQGFPSLDFVPEELKTIETEFRSEVLLNDSFLTAALERKLTEEQFSIVHIASHGQFDREARNTFVLTYDGKLTLNRLEALIRPSQYRGQPVELLVLSACQTAAGDDRAALGLAGVAVKAGARSALASLWFVNDQSTAAFISAVYDELRRTPSVSRAKAVQAAHIKMVSDRRYRHPCYWAPYLLIGNWL